MSAPVVLVVDDDEAIRVTVCEMVTLLGCVGVPAQDGRAALAMLREGLRPALMLLDLRMPGMNGWELRAALLPDPELAKIPVVILSCETVGDMQIAGQLRKPFEIADLLTMIKRFT